MLTQETNMPKTLTVKMKHSKTTKNTHVFKAGADQPDAVVQSVYLEKSVLGVIPPAEVAVTVAWEG